MTGYSRDELIGYSETILLDKESQRIFKKQWAERIKGIAMPYEITLTRKDDRKVNTLVSPKPLLDENDQFSGSFGIFTDITERKQAESSFHTRTASLPRLGTVAGRGKTASMHRNGAERLYRPNTVLLQEQTGGAEGACFCRKPEGAR
jgi:PAS domain S-box-containing protein